MATRVIPRKTKVQMELFKGFTLMDVLYLLFCGGVLVLFVLSNFPEPPFNIFLGLFVAGLAANRAYEYIEQDNQDIAYNDEILDTADSDDEGRSTRQRNQNDGRDIIGDARSRIINWNALWAMNPDIIAWIYVPGTVIDYAVVQTNNNTFYLSHDAFRRWSQAGAIYMDYRHYPDFTRGDTILYGHNMVRGHMFGSLHRYTQQDFRNRHSEMFIYTPDRTYQWTFFETFTQSNRTPDFSNEGRWTMTLVTCTNWRTGNSHRLVRSEMYLEMYPGGEIVIHEIEPDYFDLLLQRNRDIDD